MMIIVHVPGSASAAKFYCYTENILLSKTKPAKHPRGYFHENTTFSKIGRLPGT